MSTDVPPGLVLDEAEQVLFCGQSNKRVQNPLQHHSTCPEAVVLTNRRLVYHSALRHREAPIEQTLEFRLTGSSAAVRPWGPGASPRWR